MNSVSESYLFVGMTILLLLLGSVMPFVNDFATGSYVENSIESLADVEEDGVDYLDFVGSMLKAFFWVYGDIGFWGNVVKVAMNFIWLYLLVRLIRGGG